ncbi:MAG: methylenetetrahydrofolate reductase C-terminal domain-containing protein [Anaerolineales bacterium]|uniref:Methylenetetrahydrofolate reductase n=1 Tax=Candidatus Desulfolinea nitratireducens TaxID=2841698 RepID=A0A8J6NFL6_9CHLR|nr:methylenetetrahydrofolate reductase C-terminal domain-containing protein [Candidatus Desulfolinea nitratireducens]MBL6959875.1 methylenetetrahydrofolate reductase C-terminal domain-containing protein [Anaerolineales bacterium]
MPIFTPGRRWQPPYLPFKKEPLNRRLLASLEKAIKGPLFGCRMCGNCLLQETAFICPMECPKGARNGPCGGSTEEFCYVDNTRPCMWYKIYERSFKMGREEMLLEVLPPLDWEKTGTETWGDVTRQVKKVGTGRVVKGMLSKDAATRTVTWDSVFRPVRQPDWWEGDAKYHPPAYDEPMSELERRLRAGEFVVTSEVAPPVSAATGKLVRNTQMISPYVAAVNFTDCPSATPRMSSIACSKLALENGAEPVLQIAARDRTRTGLQAEIIGASALGIRNVLCLSGDSSQMGPSPLGRSDIIDVDSVQMLWILRRMRDEGKYLDGREIKFPPQLFLGAAAAPFASEPKFQAIREHKKINAGAQFFQTNLVYDPDGMEIWLNELAKRDILDKVYLLIGITPLKTLKMAQYMHYDVPGVFIPEKLLKRMEAAGPDGEAEVGFEIALELIESIRNKEGVNGIHVMAVGWEDIVPRLVTEAGLLPPDFVAPEPKADPAKVKAVA